MRVQLLLSAIPLLAGGTISTCRNSDLEFMCDDLSIQITTYGKEDGKDHYYLSGDSDGKDMHVVKERTLSRMTKKDSKYYVQDQKGRYVEAHAGTMDIALTNRGDGDGEWTLEWDVNTHDKANIHTGVNLHASSGVGGHRRRSAGKNYLAYADRGTEVKLLEKGNAGGRENWYIDPAFCAVLDGNNVVGYWQAIKEVIKAGTEKEKHGYDLKIDGNFTGEFSAKLKAVMKVGINVMGLAKAKAKIKGKATLDLTADISADLEIYKETEYEVKWEKEDVGKHVWQFFVDMKDQGLSGCGQKTTLKTSQFRLVTGDTDTNAPCCLPNKFSGGTWDTCISTDFLIPDNGPHCKVKGQEEVTV